MKKRITTYGKHSMIACRTIFSILFVLTAAGASGSGEKPLITEQDVSSPTADLALERWTILQLKMTGPQSGNPFKDIHISATFSKGKKEYKPSGFYDGGGIYRIRFMPPEAGSWSYVTHSNADELDGIEGTFTVTEATGDNHGSVRVRNTHHLGYSDGKPYWQMGTTCYAWVHQTEALQEQTLKTLESAPFNKLRMCVFPKDYSYNKNEPPFYPFLRKNGKNDFSRFDPEFFNHFESRIADLMELGIEADIILFHTYDRWGYESMSEATDRFYLEYVIARFASFRNVWWSLANEYDLMPDKDLEDWERFYKIIRENDPYDHLAGIHNCFRFYDHREPWVSHASIQSSALHRAREWRAQYRKPIIYDECRYEGNIQDHWGNQSAREMTMKFWQGTVAGCYVGHGETYKHPEDILWWSKGGVLHGESPARIAFLKEILEEAPMDGIEPLDEYTGGKPGEYYLCYFGMDEPEIWTIDLPDNVKFRIELIDTWEMTINDLEGIFSGPAEIPMPGKPYQALRITRVGYNFPIAPVMVKPEWSLFFPSTEVQLWSGESEAEIRYTLDGTEPSLNSKPYTAPIQITGNTTLKAMAFNREGGRSRLTEVSYTLATMAPPVSEKGLKPGLKYSYFEGDWDDLPDFDRLTAVSTGIAATFDHRLKQQEEHYALKFTGYIKVKEEGICTFYSHADDGSRLWIGETLVVDNGEIYGPREPSGQIGLQKGFHPITVEFYEVGGGDFLEVSYREPGGEKMIVPPEVLFHKK